MSLVLLHVGCGKHMHEGFVNTDKHDMDISKPWPHGDASVDGIAAMMVVQCLPWKELIPAFRESHRVLKPGGALRLGVFLVETNSPLDRFLYGDNINLFSFDLLKNVLVDRIGYSDIRVRRFMDSAIPELAQADNRNRRGASYVEAVK
jgi:hypothetical protein